MLLDISHWWTELNFSTQLFLAIGLISNLLFAIYVVIQWLGHNVDLDDLTVDHDAGAFFAILSVRGLLAFGMFLGYAGFAALEAGLGLFPALIVGTFAGFLASWLAFKLLLLLLRLQSSGTLDVDKAVGATGTVHLSLSANTPGKVMVVLQGALREMDAVSADGAIATGTPILVTEVLENGQLVVVPYPS